MGLRDFLFGPKDEESAEIGRSWAEQFIEESGDGPVCDNPAVPEPTPKLVRGLGKAYSKDADSFYEGFSEKWNSHVEAVGGETTEKKKWYERW